MDHKFKNIILYTLLTLITASLGVTALITNIYSGSTLYVLLSSLVFIICLISILDIDSIKIKELINSTFIRLFSIIYLIISLIYTISMLGILINNLFYMVTPITIILSVVIILIIILSCNKRVININIFFILGIFCFFVLVIFMFLFPSSNLKLEFDTIDPSNIYLYSYSILIIDLIFYKYYIKSNCSKNHSKVLIISSIIAILLLSFYTYLDLTITKIDYSNTPFKNILKYQLVLPNINIYVDALYLIIVFITLIFKLLIFGDNLRIFFLCKKNLKNYFILYFILFIISNTLINQIKNETTYLYILLSLLTCFSVILLILIGGYRIAQRIYKHTKK